MTMPMITVLLVEDDDDFRAVVKRFLKKNGIEAIEASSAEIMYQVLEDKTPEIIILDINLPGNDGLTALNKIRSDFEGAIILLSTRKAVDDKVDGLSKGADYYLPKPVDMRELMAVIQRLALSDKKSSLERRTWALDTIRRKLITPDGFSVNLSAAEFQILEYISANPSKPSTRDQLFEQLGKTDPRIDDRSLDVVISRLRKKFPDPQAPLPIKSIRNVGYVFSAEISIRCNKM